LLTTFGLTAFRDLTEAIVVGFALGSVLFIYRMSQSAAVEFGAPYVAQDRADNANGARAPFDAAAAADAEIAVYRISGAFFFGAAAALGSVLERIGDKHRALIVDFVAVPFIDSTGARTLEGLIFAARKRGIAVWLTGLSASVRAELAAHGISPPAVHIGSDVESVFRHLHELGQGLGESA
jgi:SulP family sulfate permease